MASSARRVKADAIRTAVATRPTGGPPTYLSPEEADASSRAIDTVVAALGGRPALLDTLAVAADAPEVEPILSLLLDPRYHKLSLRSLCTMANLTVVDLFAAYKKAMVTKAHLVAYKAITDTIVPVVEDVMRRAAPYEIPCYGCGGAGQVAVEGQPDAPLITCEDCRGTGKLLQLPDLDRQKLALELAQLVQKSAGLQIQNNQLTLPPGAGGSDPRLGGGTLVELQTAVREILSGPRTPILDAETIPQPDETIGVDPDPIAAQAETFAPEGDPVRGPSPDPIPPLGAPR